ncbi:MAG: hypothetical protein IKZ82_06230 [Clostridia bacterium]|nr:hypothetical protein [Clostridia bacterium]
MLREKFLTDEQVEEEIARLLKDEHVKLAKKEERIRYRRRQYMYTLRTYERKGRQLEAEGITMEYLMSLSDGDSDGEWDENDEN